MMGRRMGEIGLRAGPGLRTFYVETGCISGDRSAREPLPSSTQVEP